MSDGPASETLSPAAGRRVGVDLLIVHPTFTSAAITSGLQLEPDVTHEVGQPRATPQGALLRGVQQDTRWRYSIQRTLDGQWFSGPVDELLNLLASRRGFLQTVNSTGGTATLIVQFLDPGYWADELSHDTLLKLVDLGLNLAVEIYPIPQS